MTTQIIVVESAASWLKKVVETPLVDIDDYLTSDTYVATKNAQVINLCADYTYLSVGYYCSLLAEARKHRVIPSVRSMLDLSSKAMYGLDVGHLHEAANKALKNIEGDTYDLKIFLGQCALEVMNVLGRKIFEAFSAPLLRVSLKKMDGAWRIMTIRSMSLGQLKGDDRDQFVQSLNQYLKRRWREPKSPTKTRYDMAILVDPKDPQPPSNQKSLQAFIKAAKELSVAVDLIEAKDYVRLAEYDALFIRATTNINHFTYRFAKKAESEGMVVIDDPQSILRCTNKVYLAELLRGNKISAPNTVIVGRGDVDAARDQLGFPMVLKLPDGSFSKGVFKVENQQELSEVTEKLFSSSELILAQEYLYTEFDWRIGILNKKPLYAVKYFMTKKHWQIVSYEDGKVVDEGKFQTVALHEVPPAVLKAAMRAANLIGDGLYGVDLKQRGNDVYVIEINDNPNIDFGVEDTILKGELYMEVMREFVRRLDMKYQLRW
ncbi:MAG: RimK family protein [Gammaproteobacteria bacterium]|nr:RimK family protein [Gammaproteobacteria bacterium]